MLKQENIMELLKDKPEYVEILQRAVEVEDRLQEEAFLFNLEDLNETDSEAASILKDVLYQQFYKGWIKESMVTIYDGLYIYVQYDKSSITMRPNPDMNTIVAEINDSTYRTYEFDVKHTQSDQILVYKSGRVMWEWNDVRAAPASIQKMVIAGIINVAYKTNKRTEYSLVDRDITKSALIEYDQYKVNEDFESNQPTPDQTPLDVPENIFSIIVGYDDIKSIILKGLKKEKPINVLFIGTPGTAKSMFLEEINRIPGSSYHLGSSSTKAGLTDFLFNMEPRIILIDEFEKMDRKDFAVLLSLMEGGKVVETKKNQRREITINASVFASCNTIKNIPPENLSRFHFKFNFNTYTESEFEEIVQRILTTRESVQPDLAKYIASSLSRVTKDVREAVGISRVCDCNDDVDTILKTREKYQNTS